MVATTTAQDSDQYSRAIALLVESCKESFGDRLTSVVVYGSAALKDCVPGYSDLDVMLIIEDHLRGPEDYELLKAVKNKVSRKAKVDIHEAWVFGKSLLQSVPTLWETLSARTVYGETIAEKAPIPEIHRRTSIKMMHDLRSCWERRRQMLTPDETAKMALSYTLRFAQNALLYFGIAKMKKKEIIDTFEEAFNILPTSSAPRIAYERILGWEKMDHDKKMLNQIMDEFEIFSDNLYWHIALRTLFDE